MHTKYIRVYLSSKNFVVYKWNSWERGYDELLKQSSKMEKYTIDQHPLSIIVWFQEISTPTPKEGQWKFPGGGGWEVWIFPRATHNHRLSIRRYPAPFPRIIVTYIVSRQVTSQNKEIISECILFLMYHKILTANITIVV